MNSFTAPFEYKVSMLGTLYTGLQVPGTHKLLEVLFDEESAAGRGLSQALGLAGFTIWMSFAIRTSAPCRMLPVGSHETIVEQRDG